jgi:hypothetical protein
MYVSGTRSEVWPISANEVELTLCEVRAPPTQVVRISTGTTLVLYHSVKTYEFYFSILKLEKMKICVLSGGH